MKISIVTPCFNSVRFIEETILSVLNQSYDNIEYIIIDGGSTDGTVDIIRQYQDRLAYWVSEPDQGMYDAINKGFEKATGDVFYWINADDTVLPEAFQTIVAAFLSHTEIDWIHGRTLYINEASQVTRKGPLYLFHSQNIAKGYNGLCEHFVQQHCCFWRAKLWEKHGPIPAHLRYAGDYWLWTQFAKTSSLISLNYPVATFRQHPAQLHKQGKKYRTEVESLYQGSMQYVRLRRFLRQIARRSDWDLRLVNKTEKLPPYSWLDPSDLALIKQTSRSKLT
jgi:glycosyltransferase involved in cell wall biosynthesis